MTIAAGICLIAAPASAAAPACHDRSLAVLVDSNATGTVLTVHNTGSTACTLSARPAIALIDAASQPIAIAATPKPDGTTVELPAAGSAQATLRWASSGKGTDRCVVATDLRLSLADDAGLDTPLNTRLCGPANAPIAVTQDALRVTGSK